MSNGTSGTPRRLVSLILRAQQPGAPDATALLAAIKATGDRVAHDLVARGVLCNASYPCSVTVNSTSMGLQVCLPRDDASREAMLCEPYGDRTLQGGTSVGTFSTTGCHTFDVIAIAHWWRAVRRHPPFLLKSDRRQLHGLLKRKKGAPAGAAHTMLRLLPSAAEAEASQQGAPQSPSPRRRCAVVGSSHHMVCYRPARGAQIDRHDVVWRSNAAQHQRSTNELRGGRLHELLAGYRGPERQAGARTDYRVRTRATQTSAQTAGRR